MKKLLTLLGALTMALVVGLWVGLMPSSASTSKTTPQRPASVQQVNAGVHAKQAPSTSGAEQAGTETAGTETAGEQSGESGSETAGESAKEGDTHEDAGQNADHQCPPNCDTANGEQP
jgi:cytoskeletal protein RodZ